MSCYQREINTDFFKTVAQSSVSSGSIFSDTTNPETLTAAVRRPLNSISLAAVLNYWKSVFSPSIINSLDL